MFEFDSHDDLIVLADRLGKSGDDELLFFVGLNFFGEALLARRDDPLLEEFRPHFGELMKAIKAGDENETALKRGGPVGGDSGQYRLSLWEEAQAILRASFKNVTVLPTTFGWSNSGPACPAPSTSAAARPPCASYGGDLHDKMHRHLHGDDRVGRGVLEQYRRAIRHQPCFGIGGPDEAGHLIRSPELGLRTVGVAVVGHAGPVSRR